MLENEFGDGIYRRPRSAIIATDFLHAAPSPERNFVSSFDNLGRPCFSGFHENLPGTCKHCTLVIHSCSAERKEE